MILVARVFVAKDVLRAALVLHGLRHACADSSPLGTECRVGGTPLQDLLRLLEGPHLARATADPTQVADGLIDDAAGHLRGHDL
eukprot:9276174-Lingulodinium_polyedra.AAC.1